jgi:hypothetical protein
MIIKNMEASSKLRIVEGVASVWHYHLSISGKNYQPAICGNKNVMQTEIPLQTWGVLGGDVPSSYCKDCNEIYQRLCKESYIEKLLEALKSFPEGYVSDGYHKGAELSRAGIELVFDYSTGGDTIALTIEGLGIFRKHREYVAVLNQYKFSFSFSMGQKGTFIFSRRFDKSTSDKLCERVVPFLLSKGEDKSTIPLIINDFPEYAGFALNFMQGVNRE